MDYSKLPIEYVPAEDFVIIARGRDEKRDIVNVDGKMRWVFTKEDGTQYILRPEYD